MVLLVDILTNYPLLESLNVDSSRFGPENNNYVQYIQSSSLQATRLKKLSLSTDGLNEVEEFWRSISSSS